MVHEMVSFEDFILGLPDDVAEYIIGLDPDDFYAWLERNQERLTPKYGPETNEGTMF